MGSRRKCAGIIERGLVTVNGERQTVFWHEIEVGRDLVEVSGKAVSIVDEKFYYILNKPLGYVCANSDGFNTPTVFDFIRERYGIEEKLHSVGRLDKNTTGLLILTNDGDFTNAVIHPGRKVDKVYRALVKGIVSENQKKEFENGVDMDGYRTAPAKMEIIEETGDGNSLVEITIHEGKKRQVRIMCRSIGHEVVELQRIRIGNLTLDGVNEAGDLIKIDGEILFKRLGYNQKGWCSK